MVGVKHEGHEDPEEFPVPKEEIHVSRREAKKHIRCLPPLLEYVGYFLMKLVNVIKKNLTIDLVFAVEIKVDRPFAKLSLPRNAFNGHGFEALLKEQLPRRFEDGGLPVFFLPYSSLLECQDGGPFLVKPMNVLDECKGHKY